MDGGSILIEYQEEHGSEPETMREADLGPELVQELVVSEGGPESERGPE